MFDRDVWFRQRVVVLSNVTNVLSSNIFITERGCNNS